MPQRARPEFTELGEPVDLILGGLVMPAAGCPRCICAGWCGFAKPTCVIVRGLMWPTTGCPECTCTERSPCARCPGLILAELMKPPASGPLDA